MNNKILVGVIVVLAAFVIFLASQPVVVKPADVQVVEKVVERIKESLGAFSGPDIYNDIRIGGTLTYNVGKAAPATSTTATAYTIVEKDMKAFSSIDLMLNTDSATITLPATSTMLSLIGGGTGKEGATREWLWHNATSASSITLTLAAGAGMDLVAVTANDDVIDPGEYTRLTCTQINYRTADNENVVCIVDELLNAD